MPHVAIALYPSALASSITLPMEILQAAASTVRATSRSATALRLDIAADTLEPIATSGGVTLVPTTTLDHCIDADLLLLPAMWRNPLPSLRSQASLLPLIRAFAARDATLCAVGTASCFLAEAGVLDGRAATTHWYFFDAFAQRYPGVQLKTRHLITQSDKIYCAGSVNSVADLMVHIIQQWFGTAVAHKVERQFSPEIRRRFEAHAYQADGLGGTHDELVTRAQEWLMENAAASPSIAKLAQHLDVSSRTLNRRFHTATGMTPLAFLTRHRVAAARDMLRATDLSIGEVAYLVGYNDASRFSRVFAEHTGNTPSAYRRSVRGKLFSAQPDQLGRPGN